MPFSDRQWKRLLVEIEDRQVLPVVGSETLVYESNGVRTNFSTLLARELAIRLDPSGEEFSPQWQLEDIVQAYLKKPNSDPSEPYAIVREIVSQSQLPIPECLLTLASIGSFDVFVSTTFEGFLQRAIDQVRFLPARRTVGLSFCRTSQPQDVPAGYMANTDPAAPPGPPVVYHLFGRIGPLLDYSLREEDLLQCFHKMLFLGQRPPNLFDLFRTRSLLLIGCSYPGWLTRFFLTGARGESLFTNGVRGLVADSSSPGDHRLVLFLERRQMPVYQEGDAVQFIRELSRRWNLAHPPPDPGAPPARPEPVRDKFVFISYAHEDRDKARIMRDDLDSAGIDTWMDEGELDPGDEFKRKILTSIEKCTYYFPLITPNVERTRRRFLYREWNKAADERESRPPGFPFIQPILDDGTPEAAVPADFQNVHFQRLEGGRLPVTFLELTRRRIDEMERRS
jgi:hypothetical protein